MAQAIVKLDMNFILNCIKNDRHLETVKGIPRDTYWVDAKLDPDSKDLLITVESPSIPKEQTEYLQGVDIELYGNADAVDEFGELKAIKPATTISVSDAVEATK